MKMPYSYRRLIFSLFFIFVFASACTSSQKRAEQMMEKGSYEEAAATFERILQRSPKNPEALEGLRSARLKILDRRLIDVRKARSGGNPGDAAQILLGIVKNEAVWGMQPVGQAVFTQQEETQFSAQYLLGTLKDTANAPFPLKQEVQFRQVEPLFQEHRTKEFIALRNQNKKEGKNQCRKFAREAKNSHPFLAEFVRKFCVFWGESADLVSFNDRELSTRFIREIVTTPKLTGFPSSSNTEIPKIMNDSLRQSVWYSANGGGVLNLDLSGDWSSNEQKVATQLVHEYYENENYVVYENVTKTRQVPYETMSPKFDPKTGLTQNVPTIAYRSETYAQSEPVQKTRSVRRSYPYGAWKIVQDLKLNLAARGALQGKPIEIAVNDNSHTEDTASDVEVINIGLHKKTASAIPDPMGWARAHQDLLGRQLADRLNHLWTEVYCSDEMPSAFSDAGNRARQCLRSPTALASPPKAVDDWHIKYFGIGTQTIDALIKAPM